MNKKIIKIILISILVIISLIIVDTIQARLFKHSPLISWKQTLEDHDSWVDKGIIIDTYYCTEEKDIITVSWHFKLSKFTCPIDNEGSIKIDKTTFPEEILRNKALEYDKNKDNILTPKEASKFKKLTIKKLADRDIVDISEDEPLPEYTNEDFHFNFEGIQYFYNLEELEINLLGGEYFNKESSEEQILVTTENFNRIYELDNLKKLFMYEVDIESLNTNELPNLKRLEMNFMYNMNNIIFDNHNNLSNIWISDIDKLETLDISKLSNLKKVNIVYNNNLKDLIIGENNSKIEELNLKELPKLKKVNLTNLINLNSLNISDIPLTSLDVSKNTNLDNICLESLSLNTLDLSNNKKLTYIINDYNSAKKLIIADDNIIDMIRWTNSNITEFPLTNLNPETLTGIDIQGTKIKKLDISKYPKIEYLYYDEDITTIIR